MSLMRTMLFGATYIIGRRLFDKRTPLIAGLTLTNKCNLRCRQCKIPYRKAEDLSFAETTSILESFYKEGGRSIYLQGGEPLLWQDKKYNFEDVVKYAHRRGFLATVIYTNGTLPIDTSADTVFVSLDGLQKTHDYLRGETFDTIVKNINSSKHPSLFVNFTINTYNQAEIESFCEYIGGIKKVRGIFFYFHTPYYGYDDLYIGLSGREAILVRLLELKRKHRILNSQSGLKSALKNDWQRPLDVCRIYEKNRIFECCRYPGNPALCKNCGYLSYAEIDQAFKMKPSAILNALKYF